MVAIGRVIAYKFASPGLAPRVQALLACTSIVLAASLCASARQTSLLGLHDHAAMLRQSEALPEDRCAGPPTGGSGDQDTDQTVYETSATGGARSSCLKASPTGHDARCGNHTTLCMTNTSYVQVAASEVVKSPQGSMNDANFGLYRPISIESKGKIVIGCTLTSLLFELNELRLPRSTHTREPRTARRCWRRIQRARGQLARDSRGI